MKIHLSALFLNIMYITYAVMLEYGGKYEQIKIEKKSPAQGIDPILQILTSKCLRLRPHK